MCCICRLFHFVSHICFVLCYNILIVTKKEVVYQATRETDEMGAVMERRLVDERIAKGEWNGKLLVPSKGVLARTLMDRWLESY